MLVDEMPDKEKCCLIGVGFTFDAFLGDIENLPNLRVGESASPFYNAFMYDGIDGASPRRCCMFRRSPPTLDVRSEPKSPSTTSDGR
jgi:hypothetical protein